MDGANGYLERVQSDKWNVPKFLIWLNIYANLLHFKSCSLFESL